MCGINVLFGGGPTEIVEGMNRIMAHRGVRSRTLDLGLGLVPLGHVRLPIQDTSADSDQPMIMEDGKVAMFVGEMFNFRDRNPSAKTDLPVLYDAFSKNDMEDVDGFWALVVVDPQSMTVTVTTDPLGKKQLYARVDDRKAISSEIEPLISLGPVTPDELYYSMVAKWGYSVYDNTPFEQVVKIPHGATLTFDADGNLLKEEYSTLLEPKPGDLLSLMRTAVRNRTVSDVPISLLLSGGLDSTIVFELLKETKVPFTAYHVDNGEEEYLEHLDFPDQVDLKILPVFKDPLSDDFLRHIVNANESPVDLGSMIPQYFLGQAVASKGTRVALSGDGADELFGGYGRAKRYDSQRSDVFCELPYYHLPRLDRLMMLHTVELRCPFLSIPVVRHALSLPWTDRMEKEELKRAFEGIVPDAILRRPKKALKSKQLLSDGRAWRDRLIREHRRIHFG